jgi:plastocyanin/heme-degrading monooxygenase HmoA
MEYVQTVLARVAAASSAEAYAPQGLVSELNAHRDELRSRPGFRGMQIARSTTAEGDLQLSVETRWRDNNSLADYISTEPNVESIIARHSGEVVPGSVQTMQLEAETEETERGERVYDRLAFALFVPLGVLAFALLVIYGLSRIYLDLPADAATPLAAVIALAILLISGYLAANPVVPQWQIAGIVGGVVALLAGGAIWAAVYEPDEEDELVVNGGNQTPVATEPANGNGGADVILMGDNFFEYQGERDPAITVSAGQEVSFTLDNAGNAIHNMHIALEGGYASAICQTGGEDPCSDPARINGGDSGTITFMLDAGEYDFRCDFHPQQMTGTLVAE